MQQYLFGDYAYSPSVDNWQRVLQKAYSAKLRPLCMCRTVGDKLPLYIAHAHGQYQIKRMPFSGAKHATHCDHYEPPPELSGLGQVSGLAIREEPESDTTALALDFPLTKGRSRQVGNPSEVEHDSVRSDGTKLTLRGLLHYLWDESGLSRWVPAMAGKRSWFIVRRELLAAASSKTAKGKMLASLLFIPETFNSDLANDIKKRQLDALGRVREQSNARMVLIGEIKGIEDARYGRSLVIKHLPDLRFVMNDAMHKHLISRFGPQLQLWDALPSSHLLMIGTFSVSAQGLHTLESACFLNANEHWILFESLYEHQLLAELHSQGRRFSKGLRYNMASSEPLACAVALDTGETSTALYVVPVGLEAEYLASIEQLKTHNEMGSWVWNTALEQMPSLPVVQRFPRETTL
jgi:Protein of unknown function (DUF1173)